MGAELEAHCKIKFPDFMSRVLFPQPDEPKPQERIVENWVQGELLGTKVEVTDGRD